MNFLRSLPLVFAPAILACAQPLEVARLDVIDGEASEANYKGRAAVRIVENAKTSGALAIVKGSAFSDGVLELSAAGAPGKGAAAAARGFIGLAFRVQGRGEKYEYFYLRPTNGRAEDQVRRNHSVQYASHPDHPWQRLRKEEPEKYESYVDLEPGVWTKIKIVVAGRSAKLFVHDAPQPSLVVNDLKLGEGSGAIALWTGPGTDGYFADLKITAAKK